MGSEGTPYRSIVETQYAALRSTVEAAAPTLGSVEAMADLVVAALRGGKKVLTAGNGGSAADALHMAEELIGRYRSDRIALPSVCLAADATALTCIGNDFGFDKIFSRQVEGLGRPGDILAVYSTSGNSANLVAAVHAARDLGVKTLGFLGKDGGALAPLVDVAWIVPAKDTARIQELHTWAMHVILEAVEQAFPAV
ncbi:MAG TPA: SIS domain-containing protein [Candidatus Methylacidiphilales bacterium]